MQREADLETVARLYLQRQTQAEIAKQLNLSRQQIGYDLKTLQKRWQESSVSNLEARKAEELARIDRLERVYWDAWENSLGTFTVTTKTAETPTKKVGKDGAEIEVHNQKATVRTEDLNGDPRYLLGVQWCIQKRAEILGLDAPTKIESKVSYAPERARQRLYFELGLDDEPEATDSPDDAGGETPEPEDPRRPAG